MPENNDLRDGFFQECEELLESMNDGFAAFESWEPDPDTVNAVFRAVHSIKGGAGAFGFDALVNFAHGFENLLDALRAGRIETGPHLAPLLYRAGDALADIVAATRDGQPPALDTHAPLLAELDATIAGPDAAGQQTQPISAARAQLPSEEPAEPVFAPIALDLDAGTAQAPDSAPDPDAAAPAEDPDAAQDNGVCHYRITFAPGRELFATGNDPALVLRALAELGQLEVHADMSRLPPLRQLCWDAAYLSWDITLHSRHELARVREVFEFVEGLGSIEIAQAPDNRNADPQAELGTAVPLPPADTGAAPTHGAAATAPESPRVGMAEQAPGTGTAAPPASPAPASPARPTIRVDLDRVDRLINLVGELVISEAMLSQSIIEAGLSARSPVENSLNQLKQLSSELQERVMAIRAQPVKALFQRMSRIAREASRAADKPARLVTEGETTEIDKTVIERLADPLTHMIRNAIDHGLERADDRRAAGKPDTGTITLSAVHRSGRVVIEIRDDGAGVNRAAVRQRAEERGLIDPGAELSPTEIDTLLFAPGFSTASQISELSGRGVGMDVVRSEIQALGGRVGIASIEGQGTTVAISLPLTLAVLEGMVVDVAGETVIVPTTALRETLRPDRADLHVIGSGEQVLAMRGALVPILDLGFSLGFRSHAKAPSGQVLLLVETEHGRRTALAVDDVHDQREVVIKGLQDNYGRIPGVAAATILGDGKIALIIDTDQVTGSSASRPDNAPLGLAAGA